MEFHKDNGRSNATTLLPSCASLIRTLLLSPTRTYTRRMRSDAMTKNVLDDIQTSATDKMKIFSTLHHVETYTIICNFKTISSGGALGCEIRDVRACTFYTVLKISTYGRYLKGLCKWCNDWAHRRGGNMAENIRTLLIYAPKIFH